MLRVTPYEQKLPGMCGPAALKIILQYFDINKSEKELARMAGATVEKGVEAPELLAAAKKLGFKGFIKDRATIAELQRYVVNKKIPVIVDWFLRDDGHYAVVVGITKDKIYLQDPDIGRVRVMPVSVFKRIWFDFPGTFMRSKNDLILRRMIVISSS